MRTVASIAFGLGLSSVVTMGCASILGDFSASSDAKGATRRATRTSWNATTPARSETRLRPSPTPGGGATVTTSGIKLVPGTVGAGGAGGNPGAPNIAAQRN